MPVRIDETGHCNHAMAIDDLCAGSFDGFGNLGYCAIADQNVAGRKIAERGIKRQNVRAPDKIGSS